MHRVLRQALQQAVRWQVLARNPADAVRPPKVERSRMRALDPSETAALLDALKSTRLFMPVLLAITTGMRRGEITAMRWRAVDLVNAQLAVIVSAEQTALGVREKETKSGRARTVSLTGLALEELRRHKTRQAEELLRLGEFSRFIASKTLPRVRFHDLRHTHYSCLQVVCILQGKIHE